MDTPDPAYAPSFDEHRGHRQHRFMESTDINAAFRALFRALRTSVRRGMTNTGEVYAIEMDSCVPGQMLGTDWIPTVTRGVGDAARLADATRRRALFDRLLAEPRAEALFAYVCERSDANGSSLLYVQVVSADASFVAEYPVCAGDAWHRRDLLKVPHRRLDPLTQP